MSLAEILFRFQQQIRKYYEKLFMTRWFPKSAPDSVSKIIFNSSDIVFPEYPASISIFGIPFNYTGNIDWHKDISSGKNFPKTFSKSINIRNCCYGSAKFVWEINRLQFLPWICMNYKKARNEAELQLFMNIVNSWIQQNPYLIGVNWYSNIEVNIRLINWFFCWNILDVDALMKIYPDFASFVRLKWLPVIYLHCHYSYYNPSKYSSANNHLISEYAGLFIACSMWKFKDSEKWLVKSREGLEREINLQHSENGINKEEAAEYIQFISDFFLLPYMVDRKKEKLFSSQYTHKLEKIIEYIYHFTDINANYPSYGDDDDGRVIKLENNPETYNNFRSIITSGYLLFGNDNYLTKSYITSDIKNMVLFGRKPYDQLKNTKIPSVESKSAFYREEGHFFSKSPSNRFNEVYLHFNAAPLGYLSIAAHGHADTLSFILKVDGHEIFTDPGTYTYHTHLKWRHYFISTQAHNTLIINNKCQAVNGGPTLWLKHYQAKVHYAITSNDWDIIEASHNGYKDIGIVHHRIIKIDKTNTIVTITDKLKLNKNGSKYHVTMPFHLHPSITQVHIDKNCINLNFQKGEVQIKPDHAYGANMKAVKGEISPITGWYSSSFYKKEESYTILLQCEICQSTTFNTTVSLTNKTNTNK